MFLDYISNMENVESFEGSSASGINDDMMPLQQEDAIGIEEETKYLTEAKLRDLNDRLTTVERFVEKFTSSPPKKETLTEDTLEKLIGSAVGDGGQYGCSRHYIRTYLHEKHGIVLTQYMRARVNRILRKLCDLKRVEVVNGNLFSLVKE